MKPKIKKNAKPTKHAQSRNGGEYEQVLKLAKESPWRLFDTREIRILFKIGEKGMIWLRKLASRDPKTDPWDGDKTRPEQFHQWYWNERKRIESEHKDLPPKW